jgi:hypothetical protein
VHAQTLETLDKKCSIKNDNLHVEKQFHTIPIFLILSSNIILVLVFETYFHWIITKLMNDYQSFAQFMIYTSINKIK